MAEAQFVRGDVLRKRIPETSGLSDHYGICTGYDTVIHFLDDGLHKDSLEGFAEGNEVSKENYSDAYPPNKIAERAEDYHNNPDGWGVYNLVKNNCEHFATNCATGVNSSKISVERQKFDNAIQKLKVANKSIGNVDPPKNIIKTPEYYSKHPEELNALLRENCEKFVRLLTSLGHKDTQKNKSLLEKQYYEMVKQPGKRFIRGDVLCRPVSKIGLADHYGICTGHDTVIHFLDDDGIHKDSLEGFAQGNEVSRESNDYDDLPNEIAERAEYYYENPEEWGAYHIRNKNCEHFATCCASGIARSGQIKKFDAVGLVGMIMSKYLPEQ